jgi:hypothetical protein
MKPLGPCRRRPTSRDTDTAWLKPQRARRIARAISVQRQYKWKSRVTAKPRNPASEVRFPVSRAEAADRSSRGAQFASLVGAAG